MKTICKKKYGVCLFLAALAIFTFSIALYAEQEMSRQEIEQKIEAIENEDITLPDGEKVKYKEVKEVVDDPNVQIRFLKRKVESLENELRELRTAFDSLKTHYMNHERHPPK